MWCRLTPESATLPAQGWKLHVSATSASAPVVLAKALGVLLRDESAFKFARSLEQVSALNSRATPRGSSGKFITVYPRSDADAARIALELHTATAGLAGPRNKIMVRPDGELRLIDLELAVLEDDETLPTTVGTPGFSAPERLADALVSPTADYYSLGATLCLVLVGKVPLHRGQGTAAGGRGRHRMVRPPAPARPRSGGPPDDRRPGPPVGRPPLRPPRVDAPVRTSARLDVPYDPPGSNVTGRLSGPRSPPGRQGISSGRTARASPGRRRRTVPMAISPSSRASGAPRQ